MSAPAADLLDDGRVAHLATAAPDGRPHVVPVVFVRLGDAIYTHLDRKPKRARDVRALRRVRNLLANPRASIVVDRYDEDWSRLAYVLVEGRAALVSDDAERRRAEEALVAKYPQYRDVPIDAVVRVRAERVVRWP